MKPTQKIIAFLFALLIFSLLIGRDFSLLFQTQFPTGIDGYYYVLQIETLRNQGYFYFPTHTPLVLYLLTALSFLLSSPIFTVKIGGIILHIFLSFAVFALIKISTQNVWLGLSGLLITAFSGLHFYIIGEFLSNLGALAFLVWSVFGIVKAIQDNKPLWFVFSILYSTCAIFSHRSAFGLIVLFSFTTLSAYLLLNSNPKFSRRILAFLAALFFLPYIFSRQSFFALPEWLAFELLKTPQSPFSTVTLAENLILMIVLFLTIFLWFKFRRVFEDKFLSAVLLSIVLFSFWLTLNPFLNHQSGFRGIIGRFDILAYLQVAIALPILILLLLKVSGKAAITVALVSIILITGSHFAPLPVGLRTEYLQTREKLAAELPAMRSQICEKPFIVAQHGEQFTVTTVLQVPSAQKLPVGKRYQCVYWLIRRNNDFSLIEDSEMKRIFGNLDRSEWQGWITDNPHLRELIEARGNPQR